MMPFADDQTVVQRILDHIDRRTTDQVETTWREPVASYRSPARFAAEMAAVLRRSPTPYCPSAALPEGGSYVARDCAGVPLLAVRAGDGRVRAFRNACRHRGTPLAEGAGCEKAFVCRYHGWTYGLDGSLLHVPHEYGFPGLDKNTRGLVPVTAVERHGLVWVTQEEPALDDPALELLPELIPPGHRLHGASEVELPANWKVLAESFLEGYHIRATHRETFYPIQFDNLNVVETCGRNARIAFPYRRIDKLRALPAAQRCADGVLTFVYHLFPNVMVATFPTNITMVALEPLAIDRTRFVTYVTTAAAPASGNGEAALQGAQTFVNAGAAEDAAVSCGVQRGLASGANAFVEFGRFEGALGHFHRALHEIVDAVLGAEAGR